MGVSLAPQQKRSVRSRARLLDAAEKLLERHHFENISIARIAEEAGTSVGNFYARFPSKDALLDALQERYEADRTRSWHAFFSDPSLEKMGLADCIRALTESAVSKFRARRGVFRTLVIRQWRDPEMMSASSRNTLRQLYESAFNLLWSKRAEIRHESPERAIRISLAAMLAACRENVVMRPRRLPGSLDLSDNELADELSRMLHAYLTTDEGRAGNTAKSNNGPAEGNS